MSVDFEENNNIPQNVNFNPVYGGEKQVGKITQLFMSLGLGRDENIAQYFVLAVAIIFFALAGYIYFF